MLQEPYGTRWSGGCSEENTPDLLGNIVQLIFGRMHVFSTFYWRNAHTLTWKACPPDQPRANRIRLNILLTG